MFCIHCGARNPENASFCSACGKAIGAAEDAPAATEAAAPISTAAESSRNTTREVVAPVPAPTAAQMQTQHEAAAAGKGKPVLWVLAGFAACLLIVVAVAVGSRVSSSGSGDARASTVPDAAPAGAPATDPAPAATPTADSTPASTTAAPADNTAASEPVQAAPAPAPAPAVPQNSIVGDWVTTTVVGSHISLHFGADGQYTLKDIASTQEGVYVFSTGDGTLRLQPRALFSHDIIVWSCQLLGDSFSCVDPDGGGHVYSRVR